MHFSQYLAKALLNLKDVQCHVFIYIYIYIYPKAWLVCFCCKQRYIHFHCGIHNNDNRLEVSLGSEAAAIKSEC